MYFKVTILEKGKKENFVVEAQNKRVAVAKVKKDHPKAIVVSTEETGAPVEDIFAKITKEFENFFKPKINEEAKIATIRQLAVMTDAGIPINDALEDIGKNTEDKRLAEIYQNIAADINAGKSMSQAMEPYKDEFGNVVMAMTKLGEQTGNIPEAFMKLSAILENVRDNKAKFKKAMKTPIITLVAMGIAFVILIMLVVPKFRKIFEELHTELPLPTVILLKLEYAFNHYGLYLLMGLFGLIFGIKFLYKTNPEFKKHMDKLLINPKFYLINKVIFLSTMYSYNLIFGELVKAGIPVAEALNTAVGMVQNSYMREKFEAVNANIGRGMSLTEAFEQTGLYENMLLQMIKAGEASGQLDTMLGKVTEYYNMRFQDIIENLSSYIEPIMMFFIAGLVLLLALGIFMPMWDMGKAAKN